MLSKAEDGEDTTIAATFWVKHYFVVQSKVKKEGILETICSFSSIKSVQLAKTCKA
jgi:hypothetical protein